MRATMAFVSCVLLVVAQGSQSRTATFVIRTDVDTLAIEQVTRTASTLTGDLHLLEESTSVHYVLHLRTDGSTEVAEVADEAPNFFTGTLLFGATSANVGPPAVAGGLARVPADFLPVIGTSMGLIDYLIRLRGPSLGDSVQIKVLNIRNRNPGRLTIKRFAADSVLVDCDGCMRQRITEELRVGLSRDGGISGAVRAERHWTVSRIAP